MPLIQVFNLVTSIKRFNIFVKKKELALSKSNNSIIKMQNNKLLFISQVFYPDEVSTAGLFTRLTEILVEEGLDIEVWCAQPSYQVFVRQPSKVIYKGLKICYLPSTNFAKKRLWGRLVNYGSFAVSLVFKFLLSRSKSPVFTHSTPPSMGIIVSLLCWIKRRKLIYILLDVFPDGLVRLKKLSENSFTTRLWRRLHRKAILHSACTVVIGRDMQHWAIEEMNVPQEQIKYIPLWQDEEIIRPIEYKSNPLIQSLGLKNDFVVQYSGNMGLWQDMKTLGMLTKLMDRKDVRFLFIGDGMRKNELLAAIGEDTQNSIHFLPFQPNEFLSESLSACQVALISLANGLEGMAVPSKIYGILAAGTPVVACVPPFSEIALVVEEEQCGIVVPPDDAQKIADAIHYLKINDAERIQMGINARAAFEKKYTTGMAAAKYRLLLSELQAKI